MNLKSKPRCRFVNNNPLYIKYHDEEWGREVTDRKALFEYLCLELFQSGLSFECVLNKRENLRNAFFSFDPDLVSKMTLKDVESLLLNPGIIRHKAKILAVINNAKIFLKIETEFTSFYHYLLSFTKGKRLDEPYNLHTQNALSTTLAQDLKSRRMKYLGTKTIYNYLQAIGNINPHEEQCYLYH